MIYATRDAEDGTISENAHIQAFATEDEARRWLLAGFDDSEWDLAGAEFGDGRCDDCWIKVHSKPEIEGDRLVAGICDFSPFLADELIVQAPGQHPGGRAWWIQPSPPVMVLTSIQERA